MHLVGDLLSLFSAADEELMLETFMSTNDEEHVLGDVLNCCWKLENSQKHLSLSLSMLVTALPLTLMSTLRPGIFCISLVQ